MTTAVDGTTHTVQLRDHTEQHLALRRESPEGRWLQRTATITEAATDENLSANRPAQAHNPT